MELLILTNHFIQCTSVNQKIKDPFSTCLLACKNYSPLQMRPVFIQEIYINKKEVLFFFVYLRSKNTHKVLQSLSEWGNSCKLILSYNINLTIKSNNRKRKLHTTVPDEYLKILKEISATQSNSTKDHTAGQARWCCMWKYLPLNSNDLSSTLDLT